MSEPERAFINARLIDPAQELDTNGSLLVRDGKIAGIGTDIEIPDTAETLDCTGLAILPGLIDMQVFTGEPGEEHRETLATASHAAAAGGVTHMVVMPNTTPAIDDAALVDFISRRARGTATVRVHPMAAITKNCEGQTMTEFGLLREAGAVAFTDCDHVVRDTKVLSRALSYARSLGALVIGHCQDPGLSAGASATSGKFASLRGLPAVSPMAERMGLDRDIALLEMTGARYHADQITTARALPALARAKANGLDITAGTSIHHLTLNELDVSDYRTFFKVKPPLRSEEDRQAVIEALREGLIDIISSMHTPQDEESKRLPFEAAASGAVALETLLPAALRLYHAEALDLPTLWRAMSLNPAKRLGLASGRLSVGAPADLVRFDPGKPFILDRFALKSKSKNTPFDGARLQGKVMATYVAGTCVYEAA